MRRTQLYLDDDLWEALHRRALEEGSTISELVRQATRQTYLGNLEVRKQAMMGIVGMRKGRPEFRDTDAYLRRLRQDDRIERIAKK